MKKYKNYLILIVFTMGTQAFLYYLTKKIPSEFNVLSSVVDIPLVKPFIYFYAAWYPFIILSTFLVYLHDKTLFKYMIVAMLLGALFSQLTFIIYPSEIVRPTIEVKDFTDWLINFTYKGDNPAVNCLPSMHAVYCFITSYFVIKTNFKFKYLVVIFSSLVVLSTVFVKQHIVEDVILAFIYSIIVIIIVHLNKEKILNLFKWFDF